MGRLRLFLLLTGTLLFCSEALAHARLKFPVPRSNSDAIKSGPCGNPAPVAPQVFQAGQTIQVTWEETIDHPGRYFISWSPMNQNNFQQNRLAEIVDLQNGRVNRNDPNTFHQYSMNITLPSVPCDNCVLQLIQSMEENPNAPTFYYSCADIRLTAAAENPVPPPDPTPAPNPDPTPAPNPDDNSALGGDNPAGVSETKQKPQMGSGCGSVTTLPPSDGTSGGVSMLLLLALPLLFLRHLRRLQSVA